MLMKSLDAINTKNIVIGTELVLFSYYPNYMELG